MGESMSLKYITELLPALFSGAGMTLSIFFWTLILATPLLLQLIFVFYGLPIIHIVFPRYQVALFAFVLNYAAYYS